MERINNHAYNLLQELMGIRNGAPFQIRNSKSIRMKE
jgi:hypothetical protein